MTRRNPIAKAVTRIRPKVKPGKRKEPTDEQTHADIDEGRQLIDLPEWQAH